MHPVTDPDLWHQRMQAWLRGHDKRHMHTRDPHGRQCEDWISDGVVRCRRVRVRGGWHHYCDRGHPASQAVRDKEAVGPISFKLRPEQLAYHKRPTPKPAEPWVEPA